MDRTDFLQNFADRLNETLKSKGHISNRAKGGTEVSQLAKAAGVSYQMARKYTLGEALPDYHVVPKIAQWLNVTSGWLLFGEKVQLTPSKSIIQVDIKLLEYILQKSAVLFSSNIETKKVANYIGGVLYDASHIQTDNVTIFKIIDMMLSSATQLTKMTLEKRA